MDLDVHLQSGNTLCRPGNLEVHVAVGVLRTLDVRQDDTCRAFLHETHGNPCNRSLYGNTSIHQGQRASTDRCLRSRSVGLENLRDNADRIREVCFVRNHRQQRSLCKRTMPNLPPARATQWPRFADGEGREVVVVHVVLCDFVFETLYELTLALSAQSGNRKNLCLSP